MSYTSKSMKQLFSCYYDESLRINQEDAAATKSLIRDEIYARVEDALDLLAESGSADNVDSIYRQFLNER